MSETPSTGNVTAARGRIRSLHRKPETGEEHGLPKPTVPEVRITVAGVEGDFNRYRHEEQRDEPNQAVLLMPMETLHTLNLEGWPIREGDIGENVTTQGIPYDAFRVGDRFRLGDAEVEIAKPCTPCNNLELLPYVGKENGPRFLKTMLNRRGWYARVTREGRVRTGDLIERV